ncbi:DegQ family serine endoprotease [Motiliproteus sediminis]|uniref:DegQ family serine endoprotease n=1 Tax=Motiliproteus sediminis TaxID=1468178 RepID=UPI001AEF429A|nr:DegQ family serine endoprotease [Motiliproteus sediminis]
MNALRALLFSLPLLATALTAQAALPAVDSQNQPLPTLAPLLKQITPAVVNISTFTHRRAGNPLLDDPFFRRFFNLPPQQLPQQRRPQSAGSGVIIDANAGLVITNHHVIGGADEIRIGLTDGRELNADLIGSDPDVDLALLKVKADNLTALQLSDSDQLQVGDFVIAIGNPFGLGQTVTTGVVSALGRTGLGIEGYESFIQTDASINPGNSGGALVNLRGELVGINTAIIAPGGGNVGIGFAIPSNMASAISDQLREHGEVRRGLLGVHLQDLSAQLAEAFGLAATQGGVLVSQVVPDSAADRAGLKPGDVILALNGKAQRQAAELRSQLAVLSVGTAIELTLLRDGERLTLTAELGSPAQFSVDGGRFAPQLEGATLRNSEEGDAVQVYAIESRSSAAYAGLLQDDRILAANRIRVRNLDELARAASLSRSTLLLMIERQGTTLYLALSNR